MDLITVGLSIGTGGFMLSTGALLVTRSDLARKLRDADRVAFNCRNRLADALDRINTFEQAVAKARAQRIAASHKARDNRKAERKGAVAKTMADLGTTTLRSRAKVVAPVKAARTRKRKQESGAESAA